MSAAAQDIEMLRKPTVGEQLIDQQIANHEARAKELRALRQAYAGMDQEAKDALVQFIYRSMR